MAGLLSLINAGDNSTYFGEAAPPLPPADENLYVVHYSCEMAAECSDHTPVASAIVIQHALTGARTAFSAFLLAEQKNQLSKFPARHLEWEREVLRLYFNYVAANPTIVWVHWGMRGPRFGFDALAQRARLHGLNPPEIPADRRFDLSNCLKHLYGSEFAPHPRLINAIRINLGTVPYLLDESATAEAWKNGEYARVLWSLNAKVGAIGRLLARVRDGTFRAVGSWRADPPAAVRLAAPERSGGRPNPDQTHRTSAPVRGKNIDARMLKVLIERPASAGWTSEQWATHLGCGDSTVRETTTWREHLKAGRALQAAETATKMDGNRRSSGGRRRR